MVWPLPVEELTLAEALREAPPLVGQQPFAGIHRLLEDLLRRLRGDLLDLDAPLGARHHHRHPNGAVHHYGEVNFAINVGGLLD